MLLTVFCLRRDRSELTFSLQVDADFELQNFRALCELESGIPAAESQIVYAEQPLTDNHRSLASYGLKDGDVVILQQVENAEVQPPGQFPGLPRIDFSSITVPGISSAPLTQPPPQQPPSRPRPSPPDLPSSPQGLDNPALLRDMLLANPHELSLLKERNPPLAEALLSGDLEKFTRVLVEQQQDRARREQERIRLFSADPFDLEAQAKIEEDIRQQNIEENMTIAMEEAPESFGQVVMLYINCKVNGHPVKAFVDSGAQMTIMSQACAERCNIMRLVDRRWAGIAKGVGTQKIIGRVHLAQVQIEGDFLPCSFSILEEQPMDMLLGLDMLKRHQCSIDLKKNVLVIGTTGSQTTFLPEGELPECARLAYGAGREDVRPEEIADQELAEALQKSVEEAENSDKETTSLETPLLPTSDGFKRPACHPEIGPKTDTPRSRILDRSVSAPSVCSRGSGQAETVRRRAVKSEDSLPECSVTCESKEPPLPTPVFPDPVASGSVRAAPAGKNGTESQTESQTSSEQPAVCFGRPKSKAQSEALNPAPPLEEGGSSSSDKWTKELAVPLLPECAERDVVHKPHLDLKTCEKPGNEQKEQRAPDAEESPCPKAASLLLAGAEPNLADILSDSRGGVGGEVGLSSQEGRRPEGVVRTGREGETLMETDAAEESLVVAGEALDKPHVSLNTTDSECAMMEVELSKPGSPSPLAPPPAGDLMPPGSAGLESAVVSLPLAASPGGQLSDRAEDPCLSLTSALKELHQLLVVSSKQALTISQHEDGLPLAAENEVAPEERERAHLGGQDAGLFLPEHVTVKALAGAQSLAAGAECIEVRETHRSAEGCERDALVVQESSTLSSSGFLSSPTALEKLWSGECSTSSSQRLSSDHVFGHEASEESQHPPYPPSEAPDASQTPRHSFPEETGAPNPSSASLQSPPDGPAEPSPSPAAASPDPAVPRLPIFPAADIDLIVGAGFTPQEAGEALEHAGGNADLALLILLAKKIVVPT